MTNYFNTLNLRQQLGQLAQCRFMDKAEFAAGCELLKGWNIVIVGCGAQGLNQGLNMRDSGLNISYALRAEAIAEKRASFQKASSNGFTVGTYEQLIPSADLVLNLTPDKQHSSVVDAVMPLMKQGAALGYSHGFNVVEEGQQIRSDITVVMVAPKCPGTEVREEYKRGFGVPVGDWIRTPAGAAFVRERLLAPSTNISRLWRVDGVEALLTEHIEGRRDYGDQFWRLLILESWLRQHGAGAQV